MYVVGSALVRWLHACTFDNNSKARAEARRKGMCKILHVKFADQVRGDHVCGEMKRCILQEHNDFRSILLAFVC